MSRSMEAGAGRLGLDIAGLAAACDAVDREIDAGTMPGAVLGVLHNGQEWLYAAGYADPQPKQGQPIAAREDTLYDCASLTKVVVTLPLILQLIDKGILTLATRAADILPAFGTAGKKEITVRQLLTHTSGLQADMNLHSHGWSREQMWDQVFDVPLVAQTGTEVIYSDLGYLTLGRMMEKVLGMSLDKEVQKLIFDPLGMCHATLTPAPELMDRYAATEYEEAIQGHLCGLVHDEKARALGGVCGHAGLFATAGDLLQYARMWLGRGAVPPDDETLETTGSHLRILSQAAVSTAIRTHTGQIHGANRGLGWVLKGDKMDASGDWMSPGCYGHTGFTGTSLWMDPENDLAVVLLTNRVYGGRGSSVAQLRAQVHNALTAAVMK